VFGAEGTREAKRVTQVVISTLEVKARREGVVERDADGGAGVGQRYRGKQ